MIVRSTLKGNSFVGVFCMVTDKLAFVPEGIFKKEAKAIKDSLNVEVIQSNIADSSLWGIFAVGNSKGIMVTEMIEKDEEKNLQELGVKFKKVSGNFAIGNLCAVNDHGLLLSPFLGEQQRKEIKDFFDVKSLDMSYGLNQLVGSSTVVTNRGFLVHPKISKEEFESIKKLFKCNGMPTTANYGDPFIRNCIVANSNGALVGRETTGHELLRIDEGLSGQ